MVPQGKLSAATEEEVFQEFPPATFLEDKRFLTYFKNPFAEGGESAIKEVFPEKLYSVNMHALTKEPFFS